MEKILDQHLEDLATAEGMPEAASIADPAGLLDGMKMGEQYPYLGTLVETKPAEYTIEKPALDNEGHETGVTDVIKALEDETEAVELELSECGCDNCIDKEGGDDFAMLHDMILQLTSRVEELENRIAAHNLRASHKI